MECIIAFIIGFIALLIAAWTYNNKSCWHVWGELETDYEEWYEDGIYGDIAFWHTCKKCGKIEYEQTRY